MFAKKKRIVRNTLSCYKRWSDLVGDEFARSCPTCEKQVFNLTGLSDGEVLRFVELHDGEVCARIHCDQQGYVVNGACGDEGSPRPVMGVARLVDVPESAQLAHQVHLAQGRVAGLTRLKELVDAAGSGQPGRP